MKLVTSIKNAAKSLSHKASVVFASLFCSFISAAAYAEDTPAAGSGFDLTTDNSAGTKSFSTITTNITNASKSGASMLIQLVTVGGFVVVAISLYALWKASKDEREKPMSAIVGLFIGGAMAAVSTIMWVMKNTITG